MLSVMTVSEITFASIVGKVSELQTIGIFMKASMRKSIMQDVILVIETLFKNIISHCIKENIIQVNNDLKSKEIRFKFDKLTSVKMFFRLFHAFAIFSFQYFILTKFLFNFRAAREYSCLYPICSLEPTSHRKHLINQMLTIAIIQVSQNNIR